MYNGLEELLAKQRDEALKMLQEVMDNYKFNKAKGLGPSIVIRANKFLDNYPHIRKEK
ncbi:hypothetical protein [Rosenbergiella epipactidis]|uniref:hypothetical protein n=1 Tax=Rosenbergiella epipactidis TaxID=1544694 RepID=UPI001F4D621C|nr:hypothetical protein [Rosenbergiella epipactidis]